MSKIMVIDDDKNISQLIQLLLKNEGFQVCSAVDGEDALDKMETLCPDLLIMDIMMPNMDGFTLCEEVRSYSDIPILMLTVQGDTSQKVKGFDLGADDYLTKPFEPEELTARVKALLKRSNISVSQIIQIGNIRVDKNKFIVEKGSEEMTLPLKEFELLYTLAENAGKTFSRDTLIERIWGYDFEGNERTLDVHIGRLRDRFPQSESGFKITTIRGLGYRLEELKN